MKIQIWSDIACPWCWVGKKHIEIALANFDHQVQVVWRAFELNPQAPPTAPQPVDYAERLATKYGMNRQKAQGFIDQMTQAGRNVDLDFRFDRIRPCNTFNAHRLLAWANTLGHQDALKGRLFKAYMNEGQDLNDTSTLSQLASEVGLAAEDAETLLTDGSFAEEVRTDQAEARKLGINGVPFFLFAPSIVASGAQPPDVLENALARAHRLQIAEEAPSSAAAQIPGSS